ncbi:MAG: hypothetical protein GX336_01225 [Halanaerobiaceae bacterium]|nr:hypothetical protein [Halanaerobiaceae bacterium]
MLAADLWEDFSKILLEFGYNLNGKENKQENLKFLWEIIINIKKNMKEELEQAVRMNLNLCYALEEEGQVKTLNTGIFRLNYLLDQYIYRLDNDPCKGLSDFHKILISTYGNIDNFLSNIREVKENLSFIRKRRDQELIEKYNYLRKISLPLRGYEKLRIALITLLEKFKEIKDIITDPEIFINFNTELDYFIREYQKLYRQEHDIFQQGLRAFYQELYNLPEYRALEALSRIELINVAYNLKPIKRYIDTFFPEECWVTDLEELLKNNVKCNCGFTIGDTFTAPSLNKIKPMLRKGIAEYIEKIQNKRFRPIFDNYLSYNKDSVLKNVLDFRIDKVNSTIKYINEDLVREINNALSNTYPLKISLAEIIPNITGIYSINQLNLLAQDLEKYIKILVRKKLQGVEKVKYENIVINLVV